MEKTQQLEQQIFQLENKIAHIPQDKNGKYPPNYYALKGLIKKKKEELSKLKNFEWLSQ